MFSILRITIGGINSLSFLITKFRIKVMKIMIEGNTVAEFSDEVFVFLTRDQQLGYLTTRIRFRFFDCMW